MGTVIGYKDTPTKRLNTWLTILESKKSYNNFKNSADEYEQSLADIDKGLYTYHLDRYVNQPEKAA